MSQLSCGIGGLIWILLLVLSFVAGWRFAVGLYLAFLSFGWLFVMNGSAWWLALLVVSVWLVYSGIRDNFGWWKEN